MRQIRCLKPLMPCVWLKSCQEAFSEFVRLSDLQERLESKQFIGYIFEDVEHKWYQILLYSPTKG